MFTIKLYDHEMYRQRILSAESFTILRNRDGSAEITLHQKQPGDDSRYDIGPELQAHAALSPTFAKAIIENANGKTTEIIAMMPGAQLYTASLGEGAPIGTGGTA